MESKNAVIQSFLPKDYILPDKSKQFLKLEVGDNVVRFLTRPLMGYVFFNNENKPVRRGVMEGDFTQKELEEQNAKKGKDGTFEGSRHFWLMLGWSRKHKAPKVIEITQISILKSLHKLIEDKDWGDPRKYDVNINRTGTGELDTEYEVTPKPHKPIDESILKIHKELEEKGLLDLENIWKNEYPFLAYEY